MSDFRPPDHASAILVASISEAASRASAASIFTEVTLVTDTEVKRPSVVVLGGGYGGLNAAKALDDVADVTLVDPSGAFHHNVAAWRALVEPSWIDKIFMPLNRLLHNGRFVRDRAVAVEGHTVTLGSGAELNPDYLVLATGSA